MEAQGSSEACLPPPEHGELPVEVRQAYVVTERKCRVFLFPQLRQLEAEDRLEELLAQGRALAEAAAAGEVDGLAEGYQRLLSEAQAQLRAARVRVEERAVKATPSAGGPTPPHRARPAEVERALLAARSVLPMPRQARLEAALAELASDDHEGRLGLIRDAVADQERSTQARQTREAEKLANLAHLPVQPRQKQTARSRRALREQASIVELARSFDPNAPREDEGAPPADQ